MVLWLATTNLGKARDFQEIIGERFELKTISDLKTYTPPVENGKTFEENSRIKAKSLKAMLPESWVIADDSGLEVDGLNNMPGVFSARYAGDNARDIENTTKVLKMLNLRSPMNRKARFKCSLCVISPEGKEMSFEGQLEGEISKEIKGKNGFGYDSIFIPSGFQKTLAEMEPLEKNKISHRKAALSSFLQSI
jgi:XTP/dITP diphosphohydrolase